MSNFTDFFATASGGAAFANKVEFTSTSTWTVPQTIRDRITDNGGENVYIEMVGGGHADRSGEVFADIFRLTSSHYDQGSTSQITMKVGAAGGETGFTQSTQSGTFTDDYSSSSPSKSSGATVLQAFVNGSPAYDSNGYPIVTRVHLDKNITFLSNVQYDASDDDPNKFLTSFHASSSIALNNFSNTLTYTSPDLDFTFSDGQAHAFDGTIVLRSDQSHYIGGGAGAYVTQYNIRWSTSDMKWKSSWSNSWASGSHTSTLGGMSVTAPYGPSYGTVVRAGGNTNHAQFKHNPTDTRGHKGLGQHNYAGSPGAGGSSPQPGIIRIYYHS